MSISSNKYRTYTKAIPTDQTIKNGESLTLNPYVHRLKSRFSVSAQKIFKALFKRTYHRRIKAPSALMVLGASLMLSGCGFTWPDWATIEGDPFRGLTKEERAAMPPPAPQNSPLSLDSKYDPLLNASPLQLTPGGSLGSLGLNLDLYFDPGVTDPDVRLDRLERAVIAIHRDFKSILPYLQSQAASGVMPIGNSAPLPPLASSAAAQSTPVIANGSVTPSASINANIAPSTTVATNAPTALYANQAPVGLAPIAGMPVQGTSIPRVNGLSPMPGVSATLGQQPFNTPNTHTFSNVPAPGYGNAAGVINTPAPVLPANSPIARANPNMPPPAPAAVTPQASVNKGPRDVTNGGSALVSGIRVGQHPDKVRIVFDVNKKTSYSADLDNNEKILVVELPNAKWKTPTASESFGKQPVVKSYKVQGANNGAGNLFILQLKQQTQILSQGKYPALSGGGERIVIDLKK